MAGMVPMVPNLVSMTSDSATVIYKTRDSNVDRDRQEFLFAMPINGGSIIQLSSFDTLKVGNIAIRLTADNNTLVYDGGVFISNPILAIDQIFDATANTFEAGGLDIFPDDSLNNTIVNITSGTFAGKSYTIVDYDQNYMGFGRCTVSPTWTIPPGGSPAKNIRVR